MSDSDDNHSHSKGDVRQVVGLKGRPELNGKYVVLTQWHQDASRWAVRFASPGEPPVKIRPENLCSSHLCTDERGIDAFEEASSKRNDGKRIRKRGIDFRAHHLDPVEALRGIIACTTTLRNLRARKASLDEEWYISVRKSRLWTSGDHGSGGEKKRMWFVIVARRPSIAHCFFIDEPASSELWSTIPPAFVCACLEKVMVDSEEWPALVAIAPLPCGSFRPESVRKLAVSMREALAPHYLNVEPVWCAELPEDTPDSVIMVNVKAAAKETGMWFAMMNQVTGELERMEEMIHSQHGGVDISARLPGYIDSNMTTRTANSNATLRLNDKASIAQLKALFEGSKEFHEASPWDNMTNRQYLHLRDPVTHNEVYCMVTGNTDYSGRGLNVYRSFEDIERSYKHGPGAGPRYERLQFYGPEMTPFGTLDHVQGLNLPLASNARPRGENIPLWYQTRSKLDINDMESYIAQLSTPPAYDRWIFLGKVAKAVSLFASDPRLANYGHGGGSKSLTSICITPINLSGLIVTGESFDTPATRMNSEEELSSMCIGHTHVCNFCNKPREELEGEMTLVCETCGIRYCSVRCRGTDRLRHEESCSGVVRGIEPAVAEIVHSQVVYISSTMHSDDL